MRADERHQQELEQQEWYEKGPESEEWKQHREYQRELKTMMKELEKMKCR